MPKVSLSPALWVPFGLLLALLGIAALVTRQVGSSPAGTLYGAAERFADRVLDGDIETVWAELPPELRIHAFAQPLQELAVQAHGADALVRAVDPEKGTATLVWSGLASRRWLGGGEAGLRRMILRFQRRDDGPWLPVGFIWG